MNNLAQEGQTVRKNYQRRLPSDPAQDYYAIIRNTPNTEALLIQYGYIDNAADAERLKNNYKNYAEAVVRAVAEYKNKIYTPPAGSGEYYTVKSGDTLWTISRVYGLTVDELKKLNNLTSNTLSVGQTLKISSTKEPTIPPEGSTNYYIVRSGDSLWNIAQKYNTTVDAIKRLNNLSSDNLSIGQKLFIPGYETSVPKPPSTSIEYIVKAGDTLWTIARKYATSVDKIKVLNNLKSDNLSIGQKLYIPGDFGNKTYTVVSGDTLYFIAMRFGTTVDKIKALNNLFSNNLTIGQKLLIP